MSRTNDETMDDDANRRNDGARTAVAQYHYDPQDAEELTTAIVRAPAVT